MSLGGTPSQSRGFQSPTAGTARTSADISLGANYGHRFLEAGAAALYGEIEFVALPNRGLTAATATVPQNYASLWRSRTAAEGASESASVAMGRRRRRICSL